VDEQQREFLKVPEVAEVLRIARSRAYELVGSGEIPSVRIGRSVRVSREELVLPANSTTCPALSPNCASATFLTDSSSEDSTLPSARETCTRSLIMETAISSSLPGTSETTSSARRTKSPERTSPASRERLTSSRKSQ
jgi:excisionase family DNA binding protein